MSADWPLKKISEVANFLNHKRVPLKSLDRNKRQGKFPYYGASGIVDHIDDYIFNGTYLLISEDGDNLRTRKTPIAFKASGKFWVNNHAHILEEKEEGILDYLEYYLSKLDLNSYITGAAQPKLNKANLDSIEIPIPPKNERLEINSILNSLTGKIRLNTQTNQTLESIAQTIFKSWFVDFEPVKAKMAAKERWYAMQPTSESASPVCYADEAALPDLETYTNLAAMCAISGLSTSGAGAGESELAQLQQQNPDQYQQLAETAALFPSAMVDSELGEIPEGWEVGCYGDILEFNPKRSLKKGQLAPYLDMQNVPTIGHNADDVVFRQMNSGTKFVNGDTLLARITPCLENGKTSYVDFLDDHETGWGSTEFIVMRSKEELPSAISYFIARQDSFRRIAIQSMTGTSGRQRADAKTIASSLTTIPPRKLLRVFGRIAEGHLKSARSNHVQSKTLAQLRDALLPKLLSGEIDLAKIESEVT